MKTFVDHLRIIGSALIERRKLIFVLCAFLFAIGIFEGVWCGYFTYPVSVTGAIVYIVIYALLACFSLSSILLIFFTENKGKGFWKEATYAVFFAFFAIFMMVFAILASYLEAAYNDARPLAYFVVAAAVPLIVLTHPTTTFVLQLGGVISLAFALQSIPEAEFSWTNFLGAMVFARHPALHSISLISILGMAAVVLVAFTIQPILFRLFISSQTARGGFPYTLMSLLNTLYAFLYFVTGCFVLQGILVPMLLIPVSARRKRLWFHRMVRWSTHTFLRTMITTKAVWLNEPRETFARPGVVIANHQSFIDILMLLSLYPKLVMVTNSWVWKSPFFGRIVRYCGCYHTADGYESLADTLRDKIEEGYSVVIFPEGTRSPDGKIGRFHKGAFYLAEKLQLDLIPILLYGNGLISSKRQPFYIKKGYVVSSILPRIAWDDPSFGTGYKERTKRISAWFRNEYEKLYERFNAPDNTYFYDALIKNYTYKGPVLEWYMRVKVRMERNYALFHRLVPRAASVVDVGCGYGPLAFMLSMLSEKRRILGVDYDSEKIAVAEHGFLRNERIRFVCADAAEYDFPEADVFILNDVLHYLDYEAQERLLERCIARLAPGGLMIVRDGDASKTERQRVTELTERISTRIVGFNKTQGELCFTSTDRLLKVARRHGLFVRTIENDRITSNTIYLFTRYNPDDGTV